MKYKKTFSHFCTGVFFLTFSVAVNAQTNDAKQTVENAQKFLEMVLPGKEYTPSSIEDIIDNQKKRFTDNGLWVKSALLTNKAKLTQAISSKRCYQDMRYEYPENTNITFDIDGIAKQSIPYDRLFKIEWNSSNPDIFWGNLLEVRRLASEVHLKWRDSKNFGKIDLQSENLAKRVQYAVDFLRLSCDPSLSTGF